MVVVAAPTAVQCANVCAGVAGTQNAAREEEGGQPQTSRDNVRAGL